MRYLLSSIFLFLIFSTPAYALVVLQYHHISSDTPDITSISPEQFVLHMELIESLGLNVVDLDSHSRQILSRETHDSNSVAISFDDAYKSIFQNAYPELKKRGWPFTVFVNTQAVDEKHSLIMSWQQLNEMAANGAALANHSLSHAHLTDVGPGLLMQDWLEQEISTAQQRLKKETATVHKMLAYPYGEFSPAMFNWLAKNNYIAFGQQSGPIGFHSHPQALPRFPASGIYADVETLKTKLLSRALPIPIAQLRDPQSIQHENPPLLSLSFDSFDVRWQQIQCFATGQGAIATTFSNDASVIFLQTKALKPLQQKRSRYNCTVPSMSGKHYYWYSQPWQLY